MRGEVEVYKTIKGQDSELVLRETNLLVDGASQTIVDMLTTSPSLSAISSASALLDTSNYMIQAISFGKPWQLYSSGGEYISGHMGGSGDAASIHKNIWTKTIGEDPEIEPKRQLALTHDINGTKDGLAGISSLSWHHLKDTPEGISPTDTRLQENGTTTFLQTIGIETLNGIYTSLSSFMDNSGTFASASPLVSSTLDSGFNNGQNLNLMGVSAGASAFFTDIINAASGTSSLLGTAYDNVGLVSGWDYPQDLIGCYAPSEGIRLFLYNKSFSTGSTDYYCSGDVTGLFNERGSMDASGFVTLANSGTNHDPQSGGDKSKQSHWGLSVSAQSDGSFSSTGEIIYTVTLSGGDAAVASMFGGIWYAGLWTFDNPAILATGVTPPYAFRNVDNPRRYRLFSKKMFTKDITYHADLAGGVPGGLVDLGTNGSLIITWRIFI